MKKSKGITKYQLDWQVVRALAKDFKTVEEKCKWVRKYFDKFPTQQNWERVVNYLEGLCMGYRGKNEKACTYINKEIKTYGKMEDYKWGEDKPSLKWSEESLTKSYKNNLSRFEQWAKKGYFHQELYDFIKSFDFADKKKIEALKKEAESKPNTHKFFF